MESLLRPLLKNKIVLLASADDENASVKQNQFLYEKISSEEKKQIVFEGGHILSADYVSNVSEWLKLDID